MTEITQLAKIISETGIAKEQAAPLIDKFGVFYTDAIKLTVQSKAIVIKDVSQVEKMKQSREFRLKLKKIRTDADKIRSEMKEPFLRGANAVQSAYNGIEKITKEEEKRLEDQEKFIEKLEEKRLQDLVGKRTAELQSLGVDTQFYELGKMNDEAFNQLLEMSKAAFEAKKIAEKKADEERLAAEKAKIQAEQKIKEENERLRKEVEKKQKIEAEEKEIREAENIKKQAELKKAQDEANEAKKKLEDKIEADRQEKIAEEKRKADEELAQLKAEKEARLAPDKDKLRLIYSKTKEFIMVIKDINIADQEAEIIKNELINSMNAQLENIEKKAKEL